MSATPTPPPVRDLTQGRRRGVTVAWLVAFVVGRDGSHDRDRLADETVGRDDRSRQTEVPKGHQRKSFNYSGSGRERLRISRGIDTREIHEHM